jgi:hypothetical protein
MRVSLCRHTAQEAVMRALVGLTGLVVVLAWASLPAANPRATRPQASAEVADSQPDLIPPYIRLDPYEWR